MVHIRGLLILTVLAALLLVAGSGQSDNDVDSTAVIWGKVTSEWVKCDSQVVVYLEYVDSEFQPDSLMPTMNQKDREFIPHVLPILVGSGVRFENSDSLDHNVFSPSKLKPFNIGTWGYGRVGSDYCRYYQSYNSVFYIPGH